MNIVDSLYVTLGLDPSGFLKGQKDAAAAQTSLKTSSVASAKSIEDANAKAGESVAALGRKFLGLYVLLTAGKGVKEFVADITAADAALGRTAKNLDMSGRNLSAWQNAASVAGGSAEGITGTLKGLTSEMQRAALTGQSSIIPVFRALGINLADASGKARDAGDVLVDLNRKAQGMDPARFTELAHMAGIDDGTIALLEKTTAEFDKLRAEQVKYAATAEDIDAAQKRQSGWRQLLITSQSLGRTILTSVTPALTGAMKALQGWIDKNQEWLKQKVDDYAQRFAKWIKEVDWDKVGKDVQSFVDNVLKISGAVADAVAGIDSSSPLYKGLEALAVLAGVRLVASFTGLSAAVRGLGALSLPAWLAGAIGLPLLGGAAVGAVLASGDPNKAVLSGGRPDVQPQDNDLGLPGTGDRTSDTSSITRSTGQLAAAWDWLKKKTGFGDRLNPKVEDGITDTAKATGEIRDLMKAQKDGIGGDGVTASSGGTGGTGRHFSGETSPGAQPGDRARGRRGGGGGGAGAGPIDGNLPTGNVPGATGYGTTNAYWKGSLTGKGEGGHTGPKEMFDYLKSQGATDNEALLLTGAASSESSFNPNAKHDPDPRTGQFAGHGLFGHKDTRLDMRGKTWQQQSVLALAEARRMLGGRIAAARTPEELADLEMHYEHPRGYKPNNPRAGDNYMGRLNSIRRFGALAGRASAQAPVPAGTSPQAVNDAEVFAARQRLAAGGNDPADRATTKRYLEQQNAPHAPTVDHAISHVLKTMAHARALTHHNDNRPVPVTMGDKTADHIGKRTFGAYLDFAKKHQSEMPHARRPDHAASLARMTRMASAGHYAAHHSVHHSTETRIGEMHVHPQTGDGQRFAGEFRQDMMRRGDVVQSNGALA